MWALALTGARQDSLCRSARGCWSPLALLPGRGDPTGGTCFKENILTPTRAFQGFFRMLRQLKEGGEGLTLSPAFNPASSRLVFLKG